MRRERSAIRWLVVIVVLALAVSACAEREAKINTGPEVRLKIGGQTYTEPVYSYCWPQSEENVACDVNLTARAQPSRLVPVASGEPIHIELSAAEPDPQAITVTLLDGPGGQITLTSAESGAAYTSPTEPGRYRIQVDVQYADVSGSEAYVSYVFGLDVQGEAVAAAPTETPTEAPAEEPSATPTEEPTQTPVVLPSPTAAPTLTPVETGPDATATPTEEATEEVTEEPTEEATAAAAVAQATEEATEEPTAELTEAPATAVAATETPTGLPTARPTWTRTPTPAVLPQATQTVVTAEAQPEEAAAADSTPTPEGALPTQEPDETEIEPPAGPTEEVTAEPEEVAEETPEAPAGLGSVALIGNVRIVEAGTTIPLAGAAVTLDYTSDEDPSRSRTAQTQTDASGRFAFDPIELFEADTVVLTISAPGYATQTVELSGADAYSLPVLNLILLPVSAPTPEPSPTPLPTATPVEPTPTPTPAPEPTAYPDGTPFFKLAYAGRLYEPLGYQVCRMDAAGSPTCVQQPTGTADRRRLALMRGAAAQFLVSGERPHQIRIEYLTDYGVKTGQPEIRPGDNVNLITITPEPGTYILAVDVTWDTQQVTYYYRVAVSG